MEKKAIRLVNAVEAAKQPDSKKVLGERTKERIKRKNEADSDDSGKDELLAQEERTDEEILRDVKRKQMKKVDRETLKKMERLQDIETVEARQQQAQQARDEANARNDHKREKRKRVPDPLSEIPSCFSMRDEPQKRAKTQGSAGSRAAEGDESPREHQHHHHSHHHDESHHDHHHHHFHRPNGQFRSWGPGNPSQYSRNRFPNYEYRDEPRPRNQPAERDEDQAGIDLSSAGLKRTLLKLAIDTDLLLMDKHNLISLNRPLEARKVVIPGVGQAIHCVVDNSIGRERAIDAVVQRNQAWICKMNHS